jgi:hypothetical protein
VKYRRWGDGTRVAELNPIRVCSSLKDLGKRVMAMDVNYGLDTRKAYQARVEEERIQKVAAS